jgi:hypothetical protein
MAIAEIYTSRKNLTRLLKNGLSSVEEVRQPRHLDFREEKYTWDVRKHNCDSTSYFAEDLENPDAKVDPAVLKRFTCVQISREKVRVYPKTLALILECLDGIDDGFKRVGLLAFDGPEANDPRKSDWRKRSLKIF